MTTLTLIAILAERDAMAAVSALGRPETHIAVARGLAAMAVPHQRAGARGGFWRGRRAADPNLAAFRDGLAAAHAAAPILPAAPDAEFVDFAALQAFLQANGPYLASALDDYGRLEQRRVQVRIPTQSMLTRLSRYPAWAAAETAAAAGDRAGAGRVLQEAADAERARLAAGFSADLRQGAEEFALLSDEDEETVFRCVLASRRGDDAVAPRIERLCAHWGEGLELTVEGPAPLYDFAAVSVERPDPAELAAAERRLGAVAKSGAEALRAAYGEAVKRLRPDLADADRAAQSRALHEAYAFARPVAEGWDALRALGAADRAAPALARLRGRPLADPSAIPPDHRVAGAA